MMYRQTVWCLRNASPDRILGRSRFVKRVVQYTNSRTHTTQCHSNSGCIMMNSYKMKAHEWKNIIVLPITEAGNSLMDHEYEYCVLAYCKVGPLPFRCLSLPKDSVGQHYSS